MPDEYSHSLDPFIAFGAVAAVTTTLKLGTGICLVIQRDAITTAQEVSSVDYLSKGRFLFGIGAGWNREEIEHHGVEYRKRWRVMRERVLAMKELTRTRPSSTASTSTRGRSWQWPKPVMEDPHPPVIIGGDGPLAVQHMVEYGDGWVPHPNRGDSPLKDRLEDANRKLAEAGRGSVPDHDLRVRWRRGRDRPVPEPRRRLGDVRLPPRQRDEVLPVFDRYVKLLARTRSGTGRGSGAILDTRPARIVGADPDIGSESTSPR